ncbi:MAG: hypothetical protein KTR18_14525 [Acidiferrobacterales bacterium]|nr:hypothetical protein [Acidiferrobacterales bacterium]
MKSSKRITWAITLFIIVMLTGCAGTVVNMQELPEGEVPRGANPGQAQIVFMRPSNLGFAIQSSVFEIINDEPQLIGIVAAKKKVSYQVDPGEHLFMVIGESADFMSANIAADKTYHALVTPRIGAWKARFSLRPVSSEDRGSGKFNEWNTATNWVAKSATSDSWAEKNIASIRKKQEKYFKKWMNKGRENQPRLRADDGI